MLLGRPIGRPWRAIRCGSAIVSSSCATQAGFRHGAGFRFVFRPVLARYLRPAGKVNRENVAYARARFGMDWQAARVLHLAGALKQGFSV